MKIGKSHSLDVEYFKIGGERCEQESRSINAGKYNWIPVYVPENLEAGKYPITAKGKNSHGNALITSTVPLDGADFTVIPSIKSLSSNSGSNEGGILTVKGKGFSKDITKNILRYGDI